MTRSRREKLIESLKSYTPEEAKLAGLPDPNRPVDSDDDVDQLLFQRFCHAIANDPEYWAERSEQRKEDLRAHGDSEDRPEHLFTWMRGICYRIPGLISLEFFTRREK